MSLAAHLSGDCWFSCAYCAIEDNEAARDELDDDTEQEDDE